MSAIEDVVILCGGRETRLQEEASISNGMEVRCYDTGVDTPNGGRIKQAGAVLGERPFCATSVDGVADPDLIRLINFHPAQAGLAATTVVKLEGRSRIAEMDGRGRVRGFREKLRREHCVNGGFFCVEPGVLDYLGADSVLNREPLERPPADGQLHAVRHEGCSECMDTFKAAVLLNDIWSGRSAPWRIWD